MSASTSTRSNIGPLTTAFIYPSSCAIAVLDCQTCSTAWQAQACSTNAANSQGVQDNPVCWPPQSNDEYLTGQAFNGGGFYSPGISCPTGYSAACFATHGGITEYSFQFPLVSSETAVGCCPSGFACGYTWDGTESAQTCYSDYSTGSFPAVHCSSGTSNGFSYLTVPLTAVASASVPASVSIVTIASVRVNAPLFQLMYQTTDLQVSSTSTSGSTTVGKATSTAAPSATSISSSSLSTGAKAGIGVGAGVGVLQRRRKRNGSALQGPAEPHGRSSGRWVELSGNRPGKAELHGSPPASEVEGSTIVAELL
ncbi:hypothetical protein N7504_005428 [Penicillium tannophilum]|nr:hypothetical protein N7504_005428 [Penicillium tannophilum]